MSDPARALLAVGGPLRRAEVSPDGRAPYRVGVYTAVKMAGLARRSP